MKPHESDQRGADARDPAGDPAGAHTRAHADAQRLRPSSHEEDEASTSDPFAQGDPLWELLGQARESEVSPFFARNVARAARQEIAASKARQEEGSLGSFLAAVRILLRWRTVAVAAPAIAIALIAAASFTHESEWSYDTGAAFASHESTDAAHAENPVIDFDIINNLDELLAMEESSEETALWLNVP